MGLLDILNGMQNGPRGQRQPGSGGMSPITMALLGLLAYKAIKSLGSAQTGSAPAGIDPRHAREVTPGAGMDAGGGLGGGLGDLLKGGLGGLLAGGAAGSVLSGGLNDLLDQFKHAGQGETANSWIGTGPNKAISPTELERALGSDTVKSLAEQAGLSNIELLSGLSEQLPEFVDRLTPHGRLPTDEEMSRMV